MIGIAVRFGKKIPLIFDPMIDLRLFLDDLKNNGNAIFVELKKTLDILKRHELFQMVVTRRTVRTLEEYNCNKITQIGFNRFSLSSIQCFNTNYFTDEYW